jgi:N-acetylglutamate synthase-like GNAT family acetyltransferase
MKKYRIRDATENDRDVIMNLQKKWEVEDITFGYTHSEKIKIDNSINEYFIVLTIDKNVVGFISGKIKQANDLNIFCENEKYLDIEDLYIEKEYRGMGYGKHLVDAIMKKSNSNGIKRVLVYSATKDVERITKFYKCCGMSSWYVELFK